MYWYQKFLSHPSFQNKSSGVFVLNQDGTGGHAEKDTYEKVIDLMKRAEIFVVHDGKNPSKIKVDLEREIDLPFEVCWFETAQNGDGKTNIPFTETEIGARSALVGCTGMLVHEISPNKFDIYSLENVIYNYDIDDVLNTSKFPKEHHVNITIFKGIYIDQPCEQSVKGTTVRLASYLQLLGGRIAVEETQVKARYKNPERTHKVKTFAVNRIVHVFPKGKKKEHMSPCTSGGKISSHHWSVRGHWMTLKNPNTIGKNRQDEYCIQGRTWRVPHNKGDTSKPLVAKIRIVD